MQRKCIKKQPKHRVFVELTAYWGNGDAESTIKVSRRRWKGIQAGDGYETSTWSYYEGERNRVSWAFRGGNVSIDGDDGRQCIVDALISELIAQEV